MFWALLAAVVIAILALGAIVLYDMGHRAGETAARLAYLTEEPAQVPHVPEPQVTVKEYPLPPDEFLQGCAQWNQALLQIPLVKLVPFNCPETKQ